MHQVLSQDSESISLFQQTQSSTLKLLTLGREKVIQLNVFLRDYQSTECPIFVNIGIHRYG